MDIRSHDRSSHATLAARPVSTSDPVAALHTMALFAGLSEAELEEFVDGCDLATAHPGQVVQAQDVPVRRWHVICAGHAIVQRDGTPLGLLGRGTPGPSTRCSTGCAPPLRWWRSRHSRCSR